MAKRTVSKRVKTRLEKIKGLISEAKRRGVDVQLATNLTEEIESAIKKGDESEAIKIMDNVDLIIKHAKQQKKYETMISNSLPTIEKAKRAGADVTVAEELLEKARKALEDGLYGDAHELIKNARAQADDAKRHITSKSLILRSVPVIEHAKRRGVDVSETTQIMTDAWEALSKGNYGIVNRLVKRINSAVVAAEEHEKYADSIKEIEARITSVKEAGLEVTKMEAHLPEAKENLRSKNYAGVRKHVNSIRRDIEKIILQREAGLTIRTIQQFVKETKKAGIKSKELEGMLKKASVALEKGDFSEIQAIEMNAKQVAKNLKLFDALSADGIGIIDKEREESLTVLIEQELIDTREIVIKSKESGIEATRLEELVTTAEKALSENVFNKAVEAVKEIRELVGDEGSQYQSISVKKDIEHVNSKLSEAKELGVEIPEAEDYIARAIEMADSENFKDANSMVRSVSQLIEDKVRTELQGKYPKLTVKLSDTGYETQRWNKLLVEVTNTGYNLAKNVDLLFHGDVETKEWQTIPKVLPGKSKSMEIALKSFKPGKIPLDIAVTYQRSFDNMKYQLNDMQEITVDESGTFLVEDVLLIYNNGTLIAKETRRLSEAMDSDIFGGMLTAVSLFVKESFKLPEKIALDRLEFGDNQVIMERGSSFFLSVTIVGEESVFLSFYIAEIIREIEDKYGEVLKDWNGDLSELAGINDIIKKLLFTRIEDDGKSSMESSIVYPVMSAIQKGVQIPDFEPKLIELLNTVEEELSTGTFEDAHEHIDEVGAMVEEALKNVDIPAIKEKKIDRMLQDSIRTEIQSLVDFLSATKGQGIDTTEEETLIQQAVASIESGDYDNTRTIINDARESLRTKKERFASETHSRRLSDIEERLVEAEEVGIDISSFSGLIEEAKGSMEGGDPGAIGQRVRSIEEKLGETARSFMAEKYPKLHFEVTGAEGYHKDDWNRFNVVVTNKGDTLARNIDLNFSGDAEIKGQKVLPKVAPNSSESLDLSIKPSRTGELSLDISATYQRYFDDVKYQLNDLKSIEVDHSGTYIVQDVFLIHNTGVLLARETRRVEEDVDSDVFSAMLTAVTDFVGEAFKLSKKIGINRMEFGNDKILIERGNYVFLALAISGEESVYIPFYMTEVIKEVEEKYGTVLADWTGEMKLLEGIEEVIKKIIFVKKDAKTGIPVLNSSMLSHALTEFTEGNIGQDEMSIIEEKVAEIPDLITTKGFEAIERYMPEVKEIIDQFSIAPMSGGDVKLSIDEETLKKKIYDMMVHSGSLEGNAVLMDMRLKTYLEEIGKIADAVHRIREKHSLPTEQIVSKVAIKPQDHEKWAEIIANMKMIILEQINTREIELVEPDKVWKGLIPDIKINEELIRKAYQHIALNIINVLQYMPPEKLVSTTDKESFTIGVEGQQIYISKEMVSISFSLPQGVIEDDFESGNIYIDTTEAEEAPTELIVSKVITKVLEMRRDLELDEETYIEVQIFTGDKLAEELEKWKDEIAERTHAHSVELPFDDPFTNDDYHVSEMPFEEETLNIGIVPIEFDEE